MRTRSPSLRSFVSGVSSIVAQIQVALSRPHLTYEQVLELAVDKNPLVEESAARVQHWTAPAVPIEIAHFASTEWARGEAVMALRHQVEATPGIAG